MTVAEMIAQLSKMPQDATIVVSDSGYGYYKPALSLDEDGEVVIELA